jgi:uncharacterized membrane protein YpjA
MPSRLLPPNKVETSVLVNQWQQIMPRNLIFLKLSHLVVEVGGVYFNAPEKIPAFAVLVAAWRYFERTVIDGCIRIQLCSCRPSFR